MVTVESFSGVVAMRKFSAAARFSSLVGLAFLSAAGCAEVKDDGIEEIGVTEESLVGDAYVNATRDTYVRLATPNKNYGNDAWLRVDSLDATRAIVQFTTAEISAAVAGRVVKHAYLELSVGECGAGWGFGQKVGIHRLKQASTENGATWNCAVDSNPGNQAKNCSGATAWQMIGTAAQLPFVATASDTEALWIGHNGKIALEVTADVRAFLAGSQANHGWLIKRVNELLPGFTRFRSSEASTGRPRLVLELGSAADAGVPDSGSCIPTAANDVTCNGVDDDCNGQVDEDFVSSATSCGVGACASTGATSCVAGAVVNSCTAGTPAANDATCNGIDNDCNGQVDEDFVSTATSCGVGACASTGATSCVAGAVVNSCSAGTPAANDASCDGIDNDCNGQVDEDFVAGVISCGVGACAATGSNACVGGVVVSSCTPGTPAANDASCNGIDNDCNGQIDEDFVATPTSCGVGACAATGSNACVGGTIVNTCMPNAPAANDATCDNIDDDCDGTRDEDFTATATSCGVGACISFGATLCSSGHIVNTCTPGTPAANDATCNGIDNDCNGQVDEDFVSTPTTCGLNACASTGATSCVAGTVQNSCTPVPNCEGNCGNGGDDDGDGDVDCDDFDCDGVGSCDVGVGSACTTVSECSTLGGDALCLSEETSGIPGGYCSALCDGSPGSCPGTAECLGGLCLQPCGVGSACDSGETCFEIEGPGACLPVCSVDADCTGTNVCNTSTGFCEASNCAADDTTCDGVDDDCDGNFDEDFAGAFGGDVSCGGDSCFEVGSLVCVAGVVGDSCGAPAPGCTQETACGDSNDNDGDGFTDCFDPDCEQTPACLAAASPVAGTCTINANCRSVTGPAVCLAAPGGYCSNFCSDLDPSTCPDNATCSGGICLARCNPADGAAACARPEHQCILEAGDYVCLPPA